MGREPFCGLDRTEISKCRFLLRLLKCRIRPIRDLLPQYLEVAGGVRLVTDDVSVLDIEWKPISLLLRYEDDFLACGYREAQLEPDVGVVERDICKTNVGSGSI